MCVEAAWGLRDFVGGSGGMGCSFLPKGLETESSKCEHRSLFSKGIRWFSLLCTFRFMRLYLSIIGINLWENGVLSEKQCFLCLYPV